MNLDGSVFFWLSIAKIQNTHESNEKLKTSKKSNVFQQSHSLSTNNVNDSDKSLKEI